MTTAAGRRGPRVTEKKILECMDRAIDKALRDAQFDLCLFLKYTDDRARAVIGAYIKAPEDSEAGPSAERVA